MTKRQRRKQKTQLDADLPVKMEPPQVHVSRKAQQHRHAEINCETRRLKSCCLQPQLISPLCQEFRRAGGPRIKHVCRAASVVLGQPRALVQDDIPRLSALPLHERTGISPSEVAKGSVNKTLIGYLSLKNLSSFVIPELSCTCTGHFTRFLTMTNENFR